jgi:hypothetical protein
MELMPLMRWSSSCAFFVTRCRCSWWSGLHCRRFQWISSCSHCRCLRSSQGRLVVGCQHGSETLNTRRIRPQWPYICCRRLRRVFRLTLDVDIRFYFESMKKIVGVQVSVSFWITSSFQSQINLSFLFVCLNGFNVDHS